MIEKYIRFHIKNKADLNRGRKNDPENITCITLRDTRDTRDMRV